MAQQVLASSHFWSRLAARFLSMFAAPVVATHANQHEIYRNKLGRESELTACSMCLRRGQRGRGSESNAGWKSWGWREVCAVSFLLLCIDCGSGIPRPTLLVFPEFVVKKGQCTHAFGLHRVVAEACRGFQRGVVGCWRFCSACPVGTVSSAGQVAAALCARRGPSFRQLNRRQDRCLSIWTPGHLACTQSGSWQGPDLRWLCNLLGNVPRLSCDGS